MIEFENYQDALSELEEMWHEQAYSDMKGEILFWTPITLSGWLIALFPLIGKNARAILSLPVLRYPLFILNLLSTGLLAKDLYQSASAYEGYFHMGLGAYFIISAYLIFAFLLFLNKPSLDLRLKIRRKISSLKLAISPRFNKKQEAKDLPD